MTWTTTETNDNGVIEREFVLPSPAGGEAGVPGLYRSPADRPAGRLVLLGHGGTNHKRGDYLNLLARLLAERGMATLAIDGPGHGERRHFEFTGALDEFQRAWNSGGGTEGIVADWHASLDFVESEFGDRPTGWWGLSMGTMMGLPTSVADARIRLAVLGLMGTWGPNGDDLRRVAPDLSCPVRFLVQWDDELVPRDRCLELFDLLGSAKKTLHANPGRHAAVPSVEVTGSVDYLDRYLR